MKALPVDGGPAPIIHLPSLILGAAGALLSAFALGMPVAASTQRADAAPTPKSEYKVEQATTREPQGLEQLLTQRLREGWAFQGLDHETLVFRRAAPRTVRPTPSPEQ